MKLYIDDIPQFLNFEASQLNVTASKLLLAIMEKKKLLYRQKQQLIFDEELCRKIWEIYYLGHYDSNYNRKSDIMSYFDYLISSEIDKKPINFFALFCPGYTKYGYKENLGHTTTWKLKELKDIVEFYESYGIGANISCCYSDVFLENTDDRINPSWQEEMAHNRELFHLEAQKYAPYLESLNASDLPIFSSEESIRGFIDPDIIKSIRNKTYQAFVIANKKFYTKLGFTEEEMKIRNEKLITMYRILSDYLNTRERMVFLPMENMYERENIFSENHTCTMYLKLKR